MKKIISLLLVTAICCSLFGCGQQTITPSETEPSVQEQTTDTPTTPSEESTEPVETEPIEVLESDALVSEFYAQFIKAMEETHGTENYMVSPASLKMAFVLAAAGADGDTLVNMLNAVGYNDVDEYLQWANNMNQKSANIAELQNINTLNSVNIPKYSIGYGIWHNIDAGGTILDSYINTVSPLGATVDNLHGDELMPEINQWIDEKTNGMIPQMFSSPLNNASNVLVNTIYLKAFWQNAFAEGATRERDFTDIEGNVVQKESMVQTSKNLYYGDRDTQIAILDLGYGFKMAVVLGDNADIWNKISQAQEKKLNIQLPKFEIETSLEEELTTFLMSTDFAAAFAPGANFSKMSDTEVLLDAVIQKTKIEVKEEGLEAAAATAITLKNGLVAEEPEEIIDFIADRPFTFYIYAEDDLFTNPELLFYGQYVK